MSIANEVIRRIQVMRKDLNLEIVKEVPCILSVNPPEGLETLKPVVEYIEEETRTRIEIESGVNVDENFYVREWEVDGMRIVIALAKSGDGESA
jgi:isoleucyl-tRNA synthetase